MKRLINGFVIFAILGSVFLWAGGQSSSSATASNTSSMNTGQPLVISMVNRVDTVFQLDRNPVIAEIEKIANVKLNIELPPLNNYNDRLNIIMASGDMPDIVFIQNFNDLYVKWAIDGLLIPLDQYLPNIPNVTKNTTKEQMDEGRVVSAGNRLYCFPRPHAENTFCGLIRLDWLEKANLQIPRTLNEFENVAKALTKNGVYGMTLTDAVCSPNTGNSNAYIFKSAFNLLDEFIPDANGKVTIVQAQPGFILMMDYFKKLYLEKIIDPEWYTNQGYAEHDKMKFGKIAIDTLSSKPVSLFSADPYVGLKSAFPDAKLGMIMPLVAKTGDKPYLCTSVSTWGGFAISKNAKSIQGILKYIDWSYSDEGRTLTNIGVQGITYDNFKYTDNVLARINYTGDQFANNTKWVSKYMTFIDAINGMRLVAVGDTPADQESYVQAELSYKNDVALRYHPNINVLQSYVAMRKANPDLETKLSENCAKYIIDSISKEQFVTYLNSYIATYKPVIDEMQAYYDKNLK